MSIRLDADQFFSSVKSIYEYWKSESTTDTKIQQVKCVAVIFGSNKNESYSKSSSIHKWLFGYELTDTIILFTKTAIHVATSKKKIEFLSPIKNSENSDTIPKVQFHVKAKNDTEQLLSKLAELMGKHPKLGVIAKDMKTISASTDFSQAVCKKVPDTTVDVSTDMAVIMGPKGNTEMGILKKSAGITCHIFNKVYKDFIMKTIDKDKKVKHSKVSEEIEAATEDKEKCQVDPENLETAYPPIIQSGGKYALKYSAQSDSEHIHFGVILSMIGMKYKSYCTNISRVLMVNPTESVEKNYQELCNLEDKLIELMKPGKTCAEVYQAVVAACPEHLRGNLVKSFGTIIGIEFKDSALMIGPKCQAVIKKSMVFNLSVGFNELSNSGSSDPKLKKYSLFLADTVEITDTGTNINLTSSAKKRLKSCKISIIDEEEEQSASEAESVEDIRDFTKFGRGKRNAGAKDAYKEQEENEKKRQSHQKSLMDKMNELALERLTNGGSTNTTTTKVGKNSKSYDNPSSLPWNEPDVERHRICIDRKNESIIFPISQLPLPVHISMIKNVTLSVEGVYHYLRINFYCPGSTLGRSEGNAFSHADASFLKELTFRAQDQTSVTNLNTAVRLVKEIQKRIRTREQEEREKRGLVKQDKLIIEASFRGPRLKDLYMRPSLGQKRVPGNLEAHRNGFRYQNVKQERVDILYNNIKHAIFQPCDSEMIMVVHFKLKNFILMNKRKVQEIQFYIEVGEITTDLMKGANIRDRDDLYAEQREREMRHKLKQGFKNFIDRVENISKDVDFDTPFRELGFQGAPHRSTCLLQPTSSCLINVTEWPSFVVSLDDIETIHFERVSFSIKNFDLVVIYKDYTQKVSTISSIPMKKLDDIKNWLNSCDIHYTEGVQSLNWTKIMKTITDDVEGFFEQGGWSFLDTNEDDDADEDEELEKAEDEDFNESFGSEEESESDYSDTDSDASDFSEDDSEASSAESEESGKDWDQLEEEAKRADKHGNFEEEEDDRRGKSSSKKRSKSFSHKSAPPKKKRR